MLFFPPFFSVSGRIVLNKYNTVIVLKMEQFDFTLQNYVNADEWQTAQTLIRLLLRAVWYGSTAFA